MEGSRWCRPGRGGGGQSLLFVCRRVLAGTRGSLSRGDCLSQHFCSLCSWSRERDRTHLFSHRNDLAHPPGLNRVAMSQLTQLFLTVTLECPFYEGPKLLSKYQVKAFPTPQSSLDVHLFKRVKTGLLYLLKKRIYFASEVSTPYFYVVDVEIKLDEEGFVLPAAQLEEVHRRIALCVDGQNRFCAHSHNLLGEEAIKQRHLQLLGYEVVQIPFFEIESLQNTRKIADYLHKKIFPCTYGLSN